MIDTNQSLSELREKMLFRGYATLNLDAIEAAYHSKYGKTPEAYMTRSPFGISGNIDNRRKLVLSEKHCGANAVFVPTVLNKQELEFTIMALGETRQKIFVDRRKAEKNAELIEAIVENDRKTYSRHCPYCGALYITNVVKPEPSCGALGCKSRHAEHLEMQREERRKSQEFAASHSKMTITKSVSSVPDFSLDDPASATLQGYVYCIRAENGLCKIGRSSDVEHRFGSIVTASPVNVYLEHTVFSDNYVLAESHAHKELERYHHHGEWYQLPDEVYSWFLSLDHYDLDDA